MVNHLRHAFWHFVSSAVITKKGGSSGRGAPTRQMKEAMFEMAVRQDVYEERQNQLRWQVKLGEDQITANNRLQVVEAREAAWQEYKVSWREHSVAL